MVVLPAEYDMLSLGVMILSVSTAEVGEEALFPVVFWPNTHENEEGFFENEERTGVRTPPRAPSMGILRLTSIE
jgi:hypothetical protein